MRPVVSLVSLVVLAAVCAGCANDPAAPAAGTTVAAAGPKVVCSDEAPTGSLLRKKRCWTEEQAAQQQQDVRSLNDAASRMRPPANPR